MTAPCLYLLLLNLCLLSWLIHIKAFEPSIDGLVNIGNCFSTGQVFWGDTSYMQSKNGNYTFYIDQPDTNGAKLIIFRQTSNNEKRVTMSLPRAFATMITIGETGSLQLWDNNNNVLMDYNIYYPDSYGVLTNSGELLQWSPNSQVAYFSCVSLGCQVEPDPEDVSKSELATCYSVGSTSPVVQPTSLPAADVSEYLPSNNFTDPVPIDELLVLLNLYINFGESAIAALDWPVFDENSLSPCICAISDSLECWQGISCECDQSYIGNATSSSSSSLICHITQVSLPNLQLHGAFPDSILDLPYLRVIELPRNAIYGSLPDSFGRVSNLTSLNMAANYISGTLPDSLFSLSSLISLTLAENDISGSLPNSWAAMTTLRVLQLSNNALTGVLPREVGECTQLQIIELQGNYLSSSLPAEVSGIIGLHRLDMSDNLLSGPLPDSLGASSSTVSYLNFSHNALSGSIPSISVTLLSINLLSVSGNMLTGTMPEQIGYTGPYLIKLENAANLMHGQIPPSFGFLSNCAVLNLSRNLFTGALPSELQSMGLVSFDLTGNRLEGTLPAELWQMPKLQALFLGENSLSGAFLLPEDQATMSLLTVLDLHSNDFSGRIPDSVSKLKSLKVLDLSNNNFERKFPDSFPSSNLLELVDISFNRLSGDVPVSLFTPRLIVFAAQVNCFEGKLKEDMCAASSLEVLVLNGLSSATKCTVRVFADSSISRSYTILKAVSGPIPLCMLELPSIHSMQLSGNSFSGSLSSALMVSSSMSTLLLSHNRLSASVPDVLISKPWITLDLSHNRFNKINPSVLSNDIMIAGDDTWTSADQLGWKGRTISLAVNRLSGHIPPAMYHFNSTVSILDGNLFECDGNKIPHSDEHHNEYICADSFQQVSYFLMLPFSVLTLIGLVVATLFCYHKRRGIDRSTSSSSSSSEIQELPTATSEHEDKNEEHMFISTTKTRSLKEQAAVHSRQPRSRIKSLLEVKINELHKSVREVHSIYAAAGHADKDGSYSNSNSSTRILVNSSKRLTSDNQYLGPQIQNGGDGEHSKDTTSAEQFPFSSPSVFTPADSPPVESHMKNQSFQVKRTNAALTEMTGTIRYFQNFIIYVLGITVFILLPVYTYLTQFYRTRENMYNWVLSAAYLSGMTPAIVLLIMFSLLITWSHHFLTRIYARITLSSMMLREPHMSSKSLTNESNINGTKSADRSIEQDSSISVVLQRLCHFMAGLFNFAVVLTINGLYVSIHYRANRAQLSVAQVTLALFKIIWSNILLHLLMPWTQSLHDKLLLRFTGAPLESSRPTVDTDTIATGAKVEVPAPPTVPRSKAADVNDTVTFSVFNMANNLIIPVIAAAMLDTNCFYYVLQSPPDLYSAYSFQESLQLNWITRTESFTPAFTYNFQCSSALLVSYVEMFVIMYTFIAFYQPVKAVVGLIFLRASVAGSYMHKVGTIITPFALQPLSLSIIPKRRKLFPRDRFVFDMSSAVTVMFTFGSVFPPLNIVVAYAMITKILFAKFSIGRITLEVARDPSKGPYMEKLLENGQNFLNICAYSLKWVLPVAAIFHAFFIFDTLGDAKGAKNAIWAAIVMLSIPGLLVMTTTTYMATIRRLIGSLLTASSAFGGRQDAKVHATAAATAIEEGADAPQAKSSHGDLRSNYVDVSEGGLHAPECVDLTTQGCQHVAGQQQQPYDDDMSSSCQRMHKNKDATDNSPTVAAAAAAPAPPTNVSAAAGLSLEMKVHHSQHQQQQQNQCPPLDIETGPLNSSDHPKISSDCSPGLNSRTPSFMGGRLKQFSSMFRGLSSMRDEFEADGFDILAQFLSLDAND